MPTLATAGLLVSTSLLVVVSYQSREFRDDALALIERMRTPHAGVYVPTFSATSLDGRSLTIGATLGGRQVLYLFTTTCPYCVESIGEWNRLADSIETLKTISAQVIGISLDSARVTRSYALRHHLRFPVLLFPERKLQVLYRARHVPTTMVLDSVGRILYAHVGEMLDRSVTDSVLAALTWVRARAGDTTIVP